MLTLTEKGAEKVQEFLAGQDNPQVTGLRVGVRGGGCSGFQYLLAFDEQREGDTVVTEHGINLLVEPDGQAGRRRRRAADPGAAHHEEGPDR